MTLDVRVQPRSSRRGVETCPDGTVKVHLHSPPADGRANRELVEILAEEFGVPKSRVSIKSGAASRNKRVLVQGVEPGRLPLPAV